MADLVRRRVTVIATPGSTRASRTAKTATTVADDPVKLRLVASLARPGGNVTGINFFSQEVVAKRLELLHELVPMAIRIAVLVNPTNAGAAEDLLRDISEAANSFALQIHVLKARTGG
jgi:putative ABC transport system substrate-binding protein